MDRRRLLTAALAAAATGGGLLALADSGRGSSPHTADRAGVVRTAAELAEPPSTLRGRAVANGPMSLGDPNVAARPAGTTPVRSPSEPGLFRSVSRVTLLERPDESLHRSPALPGSRTAEGSSPLVLPTLRVPGSAAPTLPVIAHGRDASGRHFAALTAPAWQEDVESSETVPGEVETPAPLLDDRSPAGSLNGDPVGEEPLELPEIRIPAPPSAPSEPDGGSPPVLHPDVRLSDDSPAPPQDSVPSETPLDLTGSPLHGPVGTTPAHPPVSGGLPNLGASVQSAGDVLALQADPHLNRYAGRIQSMASEVVPTHTFERAAEMPADASFWWDTPVVAPLWPQLSPLRVDVSALVIKALEYSPDVLAMRLEPEILRHAVCEEQAAFDWTAFVESSYDDISDPVGNTLTTGGDPRLEDRILASTAGARRRTKSGGDIEVSQRLGYQDNNSQFFLPTQQGTSRLSLSYTQPLLNGRGQAYQESRTVLARLNTGIAEDGTTDRLQDHLLEVAEAYWDMYRARCLYLQRRKVLIQAERALATLEGRREIDALPRQILRARSAVTDRRSQIVRSATEVRNAEAKLRTLIGDPELALGRFEMLPLERPRSMPVDVSVADSAASALMHRPDIRQAVKQLRTTGVRLGMAENELLPRLDLVLNSYLSGLQGAGDLPGSFGQQFTTGRPSFAAGLLFEMPLGRRAAKARQHRRQLELVQATHRFEATVENALTEVELAVREVETSYREMAGRYQAMRSAEDEAAYLQDRWDLLPGGGSATRLLEDLLDAQERLTDEEGGLTTAQVNYLLALAHLRRSTGTLLQFTPSTRTPQPTVALPRVAEDKFAPSGHVDLSVHSRHESGGLQ